MAELSSTPAPTAEPESEPENPGGGSCLFSFGLIADMHFMDAENGTNFDGSKTRRFRQSLEMLFHASDSFLEAKTACNVMLGDLIDGKAAQMGKQKEFLNEILDTTIRTERNWHAVMGNHEFYNFTREELLASLVPATVRASCTPSKLYYSFSPFPGYKFIILDGYELSTMGSATPELREQAIALVTARNHNFAAGSNNWFNNLAEENLRYVPFNGGIGKEQLGWLEQELNTASSVGDKCLLFCHMALNVNSSREQNLVWNCEEVLKILHNTARGTIVACFAGHDHNGGYAVDHLGIHYVVPPAPIECDEGEEAFGRIEVFSDKIQIVWTGKRPNNDWPDQLLL
jgi:manganese-dependent ADP-ribose/CDP-alcohol diphosphatase